MKICPNCLTTNEDSELFCGNCGTKLPEAAAPAAEPVATPPIQEPVAAPPVAEPVVAPSQKPVEVSIPTYTPAPEASKKKPKKSRIFLIIALIAFIGIFVAVVLGSDSGSSDAGNNNNIVEENSSETSTENNNRIEADSGPIDPAYCDIKPAADGTTQLKHNDLSYVLVYNPALYDERNGIYDITSLKTGDFSPTQVEVDSGRGDSLDAVDYSSYTISQSELLKNFSDHDFEIDSSRAGEDGIAYSLGDKKIFGHATSYNWDVRTESEFECVYEGEYCYIWINDDNNNVNIEKYGKEFDENIYERCVDLFGEPRFVSPNGGKLNILIYDLQPNLGGFFHSCDLFSETELTAADIEYLQDGHFNMDHAIIHINSDLSTRYDHFEATCGTLAHEFQHLIYRTNSISTHGASWLNESLSGFVDENFFPGAKKPMGHFISFEDSYLIRGGQSLYNFTTNNDDIGVYGSVYYYAEYLKKLTGGEKVFTNIHNYWIGLTEGNEAEAVYTAVKKADSGKISEVNNLIAYPDSITFSSTQEEWMSKLTLSFYLDFLSDSMSIPNRSEIATSKLVYDDLSGADIEGGGRIIISVKNGEFDIPDDAESGLIYIGLDSDFNVVTDYIYK